MHKPEEYEHIAAWHATSPAGPGYVEQQQAKAAAAGAPLDAIFERYTFEGPTGTWYRFSEVRSEKTIQIVERNLARLRGEA